MNARQYLATPAVQSVKYVEAAAAAEQGQLGRTSMKSQATPLAALSHMNAHQYLATPAQTAAAAAAAAQGAVMRT
jgi:hypothetical protein